MNRLLLTVSDAAEQLSVSVRTVKGMIAAGELPVARVRRSIRISASALESWVGTRQTDSPKYWRPT